MLVTPEAQQMIRALTKSKMEKYIKYLTQGETRDLRDIWLFSDSFECFVRLAQKEIPMGQQDYFIANIYFERYWNIPDTHTLQ